MSRKQHVVLVETSPYRVIWLQGWASTLERPTRKPSGELTSTCWNSYIALVAPLLYFGQLVTHCAHNTGGDNNLLFCRPVMTWSRLASVRHTRKLELAVLTTDVISQPRLQLELLNLRFSAFILFPMSLLGCHWPGIPWLLIIKPAWLCRSHQLNGSLNPEEA